MMETFCMLASVGRSYDRQLKYAVKYALGLDLAGNNYTVYPTTRSWCRIRIRQHWVRFLLANLIHPNETVGFANINRLLPAPEFSQALPQETASARILKSTSPLTSVFKKSFIWSAIRAMSPCRNITSISRSATSRRT